MILYLIEEFSSNVEFKNSDYLIALTPKACYELDNLHIKYSIIEDYYNESDLLKNNYFNSQLKWFNKFDDFLQDNITELKEFNLKIGTNFYIRIKTMIDSLVTRCYTLSNMINKINPSKIIFLTNPFNNLSLNSRLIDESRQSYYSYIIPILCKEKDIHLDVFYIDKKNKKLDTSKSIKDILSKYNSVRNLHFFLKHGKNTFTYKNGLLNILLLNMSYNGMEIVKDALKNGNNIYSIFNDTIIKYSSFGSKKYVDIKIKKNKWNSDFLLEENEIIEWINEKCKLNVSNIILPRLKYFIEEVCSNSFECFKFFIDFYEKEKINFVIGTVRGTTIQEGAISASNYNNKTKSVCVLHGDEIFDDNIRIMDELYTYDIHISSNIEKKEFLERQCKNYDFSTHCYCSSHRLNLIKKIKKQREKNNLKEKQYIIYLPTMILWDDRRIGTSYPGVWYYKFQKSLIEYFATKNEYNFIWKGIPVADGVYNPIQDFIKDNNFSNIKISTNKFIDHLRDADRVICDFGSTGFYESVFVNVPTMSLYHSKIHKHRKTALKCFGNLLQPYSNSQEAIKKIDEFLNSNKELYITDINTNNISVIDILNKERKYG